MRRGFTHASMSHSLISGPTTRRELLATGALIGATALLLPALPAQAQNGGDIRALRLLEQVQLFQQHFFTHATLSAPGEVLSASTVSLLNTLAEQDAKQARWFMMAQKRYGVREARPGTLSTPRLSPFETTPVSFSTPQSLLERSIGLKAAAVAIHMGQIQNAQLPELTQALAQLMGVQTRHLALLRAAGGVSPLAAVEAVTSIGSASALLEPYGFKTEVF